MRCSLFSSLAQWNLKRFQKGQKGFRALQDRQQLLQWPNGVLFAYRFTAQVHSIRWRLGTGRSAAVLCALVHSWSALACPGQSGLWWPATAQTHRNETVQGEENRKHGPRTSIDASRWPERPNEPQLRLICCAGCSGLPVPLPDAGTPPTEPDKGTDQLGGGTSPQPDFHSGVWGKLSQPEQ